jgi:outer membrane protein assembly factor BamB
MAMVAPKGNDMKPSVGNRSKTFPLPALPVTVLVLVLVAELPAADWLQWGGPKGDFTVDVRGLAEDWPESGPPQLWKRRLGDGYSCVLSKGDGLFTMYREKDEEIVVALDAATGETRWEHRAARTIWPDMVKDFGEGPNATPTIVGDRIISVGVAGHVRGLDVRSGSLLWEHDLPAEYGRRKRKEEYGYSISPLLYREQVIVAAGGDKHGVVALNPKDGSVVWASEPCGVSYAQPVVTKLRGRDQYVFFSPTEIIGLDPGTGEFLWRHPVVCDSENNLTPAVRCDESHLWVASQFAAGGGRLLELAGGERGGSVAETWFSPKLRATHSTFINLGDHVYGSIGGNDVSFFAAFDWRTGRILWRQRGMHKALCLYADEKVVALDETGLLTLAKISPSGLSVLDTAQITEAVSWTVPTLVSTTLYVRDRKHIMALDLAKGTP